MDVLIPVELNPIGLINILPVFKSFLTYIETEVPIPTERDGLNSKFILSLLINSWYVDNETVDLILSTFPFIWKYCVSIE